MVKYTLNYWLRQYYKIQEDIMLCYRPTPKSNWSDRVSYLDQDYEPEKPYNHRAILTNEIVIEFDEKDKEVNSQKTNEVCKRLETDGIQYARWYSGGKSEHIHFFVDVGEALNIPVLKTTVIKHYSEGIGKPDIQLTAANHLIRAEHGLHESSGKKKVLLSVSKHYPFINKIKPEIWGTYNKERARVFHSIVTKDVNKLVEHPGLRWILTAEEFRTADDGRERALFMLIHVLKPKYKDNKQGLIEFLQNWYKYSSGRTLTPEQIAGKVYYHWNKEYRFGERYINNLLEELGRTDLIRTQ